MRKGWLIGLNIVLVFLIAVVSFWAYQAYGSYHLRQFVAAHQKDLAPSSSYELKVGKSGKTQITAYLPLDVQQQKVLPMEEAILDFVADTVGKKAVEKETNRLIFVKSKEIDSDFPSIRQEVLVAQIYRVKGLSIRKSSQEEKKSILLTQDNHRFTLGMLFSDEAGAKALVAQQLEKELQASGLDDAERAQQRSDFHQTDWNQLFFSYQDSQLTIFLPHPQGDFSTITFPVSRLFSVIQKDYLATKDREAYEQYQRELEAQKSQKRIAITFDDGPNPATTPQVLDILKKYHIKATFFILGQAVGGNEALLKRMVAEGHELGNHSFSHPVLTNLSPDQVKQEIQQTQEVIQKASGVTPTFLRPPYGAVNSSVMEAVQMPALCWSVDSLDWKSHNIAAIRSQIKASIQPGGVILLHDIHQTTVDALPAVLDELVAQDYQFVTASELLGPTLNPTQIYYQKEKD